MFANPAYRPPNATQLPTLTDDMIREYAREKPSQAQYAELALRGCRNSRAEIAMALSCDPYVRRSWM